MNALNLIKLVKGKAIGAQDRFVDTWNAVVDFVRNLKGDADISDPSKQGLLTVDRSDPSRPVIRISDEAAAALSSNLSVQGNDGAAAVSGTKLVFDTGSDSNVKISATEYQGTITVKIDVYYVTQS